MVCEGLARREGGRRQPAAVTGSRGPDVRGGKVLESEPITSLLRHARWPPRVALALLLHSFDCDRGVKGWGRVIHLVCPSPLI